MNLEEEYLPLGVPRNHCARWLVAASMLHGIGSNLHGEAIIHERQGGWTNLGRDIFRDRRGLV